jgi:hypothetical protein
MGNHPTACFRHQRLEPNDFVSDPCWFWLGEDAPRCEDGTMVAPSSVSAAGEKLLVHPPEDPSPSRPQPNEPYFHRALLLETGVRFLMVLPIEDPYGFVCPLNGIYDELVCTQQDLGTM